MDTLTEKSIKVKKKRKRRYNLSHWELTSMVIPGVIFVLIFSYLPLVGLTLAFKDFKFNLGILGSPWVGVDNFKFIFKAQSFYRLLRNTLGYNIIFIILKTIISVLMALCLDRISKSGAIKFFQSSMLLPHFISWIVISYMCYSFLAVDNGMANVVLQKLGYSRISFYSEPKYWPFIITFFYIWKGIGFSMLLYYGSILGIDTSLFEALKIDGGTEWDRIRCIILPHLRQIIVITVILDIGKIFYSDSGLFYYLPKDSGALYNVTDVLDTYILRALRSSGSINTSSAVSFLQSITGFLLVIVTNVIVRKIDKESAMF